jgi:hypothetical protein
VTHPETKKHVAPVELCPILKTLYKILIKRLECSWIMNFAFSFMYVAITAALICLPLTLAGILVPILFSRRYEMSQCMIQGKELRWHSVNPSTGRLSLVYLKVIPSLRGTFFLCADLLGTCRIVDPSVCTGKCMLFAYMYACKLVSSVMSCCSVAR